MSYPLPSNIPWVGFIRESFAILRTRTLLNRTLFHVYYLFSFLIPVSLVVYHFDDFFPTSDWLLGNLGGESPLLILFLYVIFQLVFLAYLYFVMARFFPVSPHAVGKLFVFELINISIFLFLGGLESLQNALITNGAMLMAAFYFVLCALSAPQFLFARDPFSGERQSFFDVCVIVFLGVSIGYMFGKVLVVILLNNLYSLDSFTSRLLFEFYFLIALVGNILMVLRLRKQYRVLTG